MSLNGIVGNALSGLQAAQIGLRSASNNVANVNTPGYARTEVNLAARNSAGQGMGVEVTGITRVTDRFLQAASMRANADSEAASTVFSMLDRLQAQFGATNDAGSLFGRLDQAFSSLNAAALSPSEQVTRQAAASELQTFFDEASRLSAEVRGLRDEADSRIASAVGRVNEILAELQTLNSEVGQLDASGSDVTGAMNRQSELLDELGGLMDVRADVQSDGRLFVRTGDGVGLLDNSRLVLEYTGAGTGAYGVDYGEITAEVSASGATVSLDAHIKSGEIAGLMQLRDEELPALADALSEFAAGVADGLNAAHNNASTVPAPNVLEGRNTGLIATDQLTGSGQSSLAIVDGSGQLVDRVDLAFNAGGFTVDGNAGTTITDLVNELNTAFGGAATASFTNGRLTIDAADPTHGVAAVQDEAAPASLGGRGFAHFFGLNDLVDSARPSFFDTAIQGASPNGLAAGGEIGFAVFDSNGRRVSDITVPAAVGGDVNAMIADINTAIAPYGSYALDGQGALNFTPGAGYEQFDLAVTRDSTLRTGADLSFTQLFGIGDAARMPRAENLEVAAHIRSDSSQLGLSRLDLDGAPAVGDLVLAEGDTRGGQDLADAINTKRGFDTAGSLAGGQATLGEYAARLAGDVGSRAARAERREAGAEAVKTAADQKRADVEGVNMDEELARMTLFQQSYNASARLLQASKEMTDALLAIV